MKKWLFFLPFCLFFFLSSGKSWAVGEAIVSIHKKPFLKKYKVELSLMMGWSPSNPFLTYFPVEGRLGFHLNEMFAIELSGGWQPPFGSDDAKKYKGPVRNSLFSILENDPIFVSARLYEQQVFYANLSLVITPLFGKFRLAGANHIMYWDIYFHFGGGVTGVYDQEVSGQKNSNPENNPITLRPTLTVGFGNRLWLTRWMALKLDIRQSMYQKLALESSSQGGLAQYLNINLGLSFLF